MATTLVKAPPRPAPRAGRRRGTPHGAGWVPWAFVGPAVLYLVVFQGYPLLQELRLSLTRTSLLTPTQGRNVGLDNFRDLFAEPDFRHTLFVTGLYVVVCVAGSIAAGLGTAVLLNEKFRGRGIGRSLVMVPWAAPPVAVALIATWMLNAQYGIVNRALGALGLSIGGGSWLDNQSAALPTILLTTVWQLFPFTSVVLLAALQSVPGELKEAAAMDGAGRWRVFQAVTWPTIRPTVGLLTLLMTIWSLRRFELIWIMTQGGPVNATKTLVIDLYRRAFQFSELGSAAAVGMVGLSVSLSVTFVYFWLLRRAERAEARA